MTYELCVLGAGTILPRTGYGCSGYALRDYERDRVTLLDCGPGSVRALAQFGLGVDQVERVVLSHYHTDHWLDVFALSFARRNPQVGQREVLERIGPTGLLQRLKDAPTALGDWVNDPDAHDREVDTAEGSGALEAGELKLRWVTTGHAPHALAWRIQLPDGFSLTYSGDSGEVDALAELAKGCDLFLCEAAYPEPAPNEAHLTAAGAGRLAQRAGVGALLLTHFYPDVEPGRAVERAAGEFSGPVAAAYDGLSLPLRA